MRCLSGTAFSMKQHARNVCMTQITVGPSIVRSSVAFQTQMLCSGSHDTPALCERTIPKAFECGLDSCGST